MMFPRYFRWISAFGVLAALVVLVIMALPVMSGMAPASDLIRPVIAAVAFGWAFTQSTKACPRYIIRADCSPMA